MKKIVGILTVCFLLILISTVYFLNRGCESDNYAQNLRCEQRLVELKDNAYQRHKHEMKNEGLLIDEKLMLRNEVGEVLSIETILCKSDKYDHYYLKEYLNIVQDRYFNNS